MTATAVTRAFDKTITSGPGDFWLSAIVASFPNETFVINPGQTRTIDVTIRPSGQAGTVVRGDLYVDDNMEEAGVSSGSELTELPYAYTIG